MEAFRRQSNVDAVIEKVLDPNGVQSGLANQDTNEISCIAVNVELVSP